MLTKSDLAAIQNLLKPFATKDDLKDLAKQKDLLLVKQDLAIVKKDITDMKLTLNGFASFTAEAVHNIFDWTQDIHESLVKKKLPERVEKLERLIKAS